MENIEALYSIYKKYPVICTDTRKITSRCLFFCLKGENFDGNAYAEKALQSGAACVVTENLQFADQPGFFVVDDSLAALQQLAAYHRRQLDIPFIGITGTNGKTTTKELVAKVLATRYRVSFTQGNFNNHIGVPLTILAIPRTTEVAIIEMGANHPGEIEDLCEISQPDFGAITNIGTAHIEGFGSKAKIIETKTALYRAVMKKNGTIFVNVTDNVLTPFVADYAHAIYFGSEKSACDGIITDMDPFLHLMVEGVAFQTHLTGEYNLSNILCAITIGLHFGVSLKNACAAVASYMPQNHRSQIVEQGNNTIIADYYNANPTSMVAAIHNLAHLRHAHKVAILGDMLELGAVSATEHKQVIALCKKLEIQAYFVGEHFCQWKKNQNNFFQNVEELNRFLAANHVENAMILLKGSRGIHLESVEL